MIDIGSRVFHVTETKPPVSICGMVVKKPDQDGFMHVTRIEPQYPCSYYQYGGIYNLDSKFWFESEEEAWLNHFNKKEQMTMKIVSEQKTDISVYDMKDGQIGVITKWYTETSEYIGRIVQRYENALVSLGRSHMNSWPNLFDSKSGEKEEFRVRILPKGTQLEI